MAKTKQQNIQSLKSKKHRKDQSHLHFAMTSKNYLIMGLGIALIVLGYFFMSENSVDGFLPTTVAPVLLIIGYCVIVPVGILYKDKNVNTAEAEEIKEIKIEPKAKISTSNIQTK
ncbi:MAG: hypothetical protein IPI04_05700 [Ignavibacteria bacterium]|nr:hypothetical protein [Ignavibacteria bacterium]